MNKESVPYNDGKKILLIYVVLFSLIFSGDEITGVLLPDFLSGYRSLINLILYLGSVWVTLAITPVILKLKYPKIYYFPNEKAEVLTAQQIVENIAEVILVVCFVVPLGLIVFFAIDSVEEFFVRIVEQIPFADIDPQSISVIAGIFAIGIFLTSLVLWVKLGMGLFRRYRSFWGSRYFAYSKNLPP